MKQIKYLLAIILYLSFLSCKKEHSNNPDGPPYTISYTSKALPYIQLPAGRHYIYKDSATGNLDSVTIDYANLKTGFVDLGELNGVDLPPVNYSYFEFSFTKYMDPVNTHVGWLLGGGTLYVKIGAVPITSNIDTFAMELFYGQTHGTAYRIFYMSEDGTAITSMQVETVTYNDVVVTTTEYEDPSSPDYKKLIYCWAKNIGLIKSTEIVFGGYARTYTLLRYN